MPLILGHSGLAIVFCAVSDDHIHVGEYREKATLITYEPQADLGDGGGFLAPYLAIWGRGMH